MIKDDLRALIRTVPHFMIDDLVATGGDGLLRRAIPRQAQGTVTDFATRA
jgi:hypothetical protein